MNAYRMLEILIQQNQFELLEGKDEFHTPQDIRLVYLMNDAVERADHRRLSCRI